jgi:transcriptional regulator with XRE-family HTH domain
LLVYEPNLFITQSFGQRIKAYRLLCGITQEDFARQLQIDPSALGRWEQDEGQPKRIL